ncbi:hypothetical protein B0F90DRAFT_963912 [Multifurca ochricompacta]|uniref:Uncharacterized protein n=1 Tax=Multifurca ochricompacta TaxID=376703 RepID=A0AAD4QRI4_9AGAM|nr:hypothetical protein B0F90DRAFT_963912 [Multifurca ochricompacta]
MPRTVAPPATSPPSHSPPLSGASSPIQSRRVQQRRGSTSAADPWGAHIELNMNPGRTTSCKLTIIRVNPTPAIQLDEQPPSPQHRRHIGFGAQPQNSHRRHGSHGNGNSGKNENARLSFASASFAPPGSSSGPGPRPGSPTHVHTHAHSHAHGHTLHRRSSAQKPRLSADQIVSLAKQSCNPQSAPSSPRTPGDSPTAAAAGSPVRTSFTVIPDDVFLPFVDRADEVTALFTSPQPGARLFALLAQTFPPHTASESPVTDDTVFKTDPRQWSSAQLEYWMKQVDRDIVSDEFWVGLIRRCVLYHSELIWERIKGALGAPPELDPNDFEEDPFTVPKPLTFNDLKTDTLSELLASPTEVHPPPNPDTVSQPAPDHVSESNTFTSAGDSPVVAALSIEPVLMSTSPGAEHDHPPTRPGGHRMHDISEDVRGESSENEDDEPAESSSPFPPREVIQGLCISTAPSLPGLFAADSGHVPISRALSMSSVAQQQPSKVPDEHSSPSGSMTSSRRRWSYAASNASSEVYDVVGERGPGNPLFPTNFARLALGPTLTANNPALRSQILPPASAFSNPHAIRADVLRGRRGKPSWADGWDPTKHEYAVTGSESSAGGH